MCSKNIYYIQRKKGITQARGIRSETSKAENLKPTKRRHSVDQNSIRVTLCIPADQQNMISQTIHLGEQR